MLTTLPKNSLKVKISLSSVVTKITDKIKSEIKDINLDEVKKDIEIIVYIMKLIDEALSNNEIVDKNVSKKICKNELLTVVLKQLFQNISDEELSDFDSKIEFILNNNIIKKKSIILKQLKSVSNFFFKK